MINTTKVVGYHYDGQCYCKSCFEQSNADYKHMLTTQGGYSEEEAAEEIEFDLEGHGGVLFAGDEFDYEPTCFTCQEAIEVDVIPNDPSLL